MQSIFRLAWCTDPASDEKPEKAMLPKMRQPPVVDIPFLNTLKRKRADSQTFDLLPSPEDAKRRKLSDAPNHTTFLPGRRQSDALINGGPQDERAFDVASHTPSQYPQVDIQAYTSGSLPAVSNNVATNTTSGTRPSVKPRRSSGLDSKPELSEEEKRSHLQQVIEHQFNIEILVKHRELQCIEQELAKCQVALEQLRRCEIIPYPGATGLSEAISSGTGPALKPQPGFTQPQSPAPWGVTDGPYSRHYARWLLNDPTFDSMPFHHAFPTADAFGVIPEGRSTRNSGAGVGKPSKTRSTRDSVGNFSQALPNYPAQGRGKQGPLVIRRLADNLFVKLICNNCQRGDFSSVQGFLNHCRIAHKVDYKSHEAAALDCGRPLEDDESHLIPQGAPSATPVAPKPQAPKAIAPAVTQTPTAGLVHPLNAQVIPRHTWKRQAAVATSTSTSSQAHQRSNQKREINVSDAASSFHATPLVGSNSTPYLSAQFARRGLGGNLQHVIARSREKIDLGPEPVEDDDSQSTPSRVSEKGNTSAISVGRAAAAALKETPQSRKGQHRPVPIVPQHHSAVFPPSPHDVNLSPHTAESDPGLVSDHEDDDAASDLDEAHSERHHSPNAVSSLPTLRASGTCGEAMEVDVEVEDDADVHSVLIRPRSLGLQMRATGSPSRGGAARFGEAAK